VGAIWFVAAHHIEGFHAQECELKAVKLLSARSCFNCAISVSGKVSTFSINVGTPQPEGTFGSAGPWGAAGVPFWTGQDNTPVSYTCPGKEVLAGMTFIMKSDGVGRHPWWVQYICKTLGP
jgi:hypothetical protein